MTSRESAAPVELEGSAALAEAVLVVDALREHDAWCAAQTHATLARYATEEGHSVAAAAKVALAAG